jgi:pimeloyl-ACP methyl ester carboxylesterase
MKKLLILAAVLLLLVIPLSASAEAPPDYFVDESKLPFDPLPGLDSQRFWGIHNNAGYRIEVPAAWNGDLVVWAHGFRGSDLELTVENPPMREWLVANGYAWASSSYSKNNYDVAQGAKDTHALTQFFNGIAAKPNRTYLVGASMGGHVTAVAIEQWPKAYDGAMPVCGVLGDYRLFDFFTDFNLVAQALAGVDAQFPPADNYLSVTVPAVKASLEVIPGTFPFTLNAQGQQLKAVTEIQSGGDRPLFDQGFLLWNGVAGDFLFGLGANTDALTGVKGTPVDNSDTVYQFDADPALTPEEQALNDSVLRLVRDPQARHPNGLANVPAVNGTITIPVLTLHTLGDLFVPFSMEQIYAERVKANGAGDLLVQRAIRDVGHCAFTGEEIVTGFADLVNWVENGVKPSGDDVLDAAAVADPAFGCAFTSQDRLYPPPLAIPACP